MAPDRKYDVKLFRLVKVLNLLDSGRLVSTKDLARRFNISVRTAQRDLVLLNSAGFPVCGPDNGKYRFIEGFSLQKIALSQEEASLMTLFHDISGSLGGRFPQVFAGLFAKLLNPRTDTPYFVKMPSLSASGETIPFLKDLESAVDQSQKIEIVYAKGRQDARYRLCPLKLIHYDGFWYLLARRDEDEQMRKFRMDRIKAMDMLDENFVVPPNLQAVLEHSVNIWFTEKRDKKVVLRIDAAVADYFRRKTYFPMQTIVKDNRDGSIVVETMVGQFEEIVPVIMQWIPWIKVDSPEGLKNAILGRLRVYET